MERMIAESGDGVDQMETVEEIENTDIDLPLLPRPEDIQFGGAYDIPEGRERLTHRLSNLAGNEDDDDPDDDYVDVDTDLPHTHHTAAGHAPQTAQQPQQPEGPTTKEDYAAKGYDTGLFAIPADPRGPYSEGQARPQVFSGPGPAPARKTFKEKKEEHERKVKAKKGDTPSTESGEWVFDMRGGASHLTSQLPSQYTSPSNNDPSNNNRSNIDSSDFIPPEIDPTGIDNYLEVAGVTPVGTSNTIPGLTAEERKEWETRRDPFGNLPESDSEEPEAEKDKGKEPEKTDDQSNPLDPMFVPPTSVKGPYGSGVNVPVMGVDDPGPRTPILDRLGAWADRVEGEEKPEEIPLGPKIDKGKEKENVAEKPKPKPLNPMFENYPPRNDEAFVDGAIPERILKAPVMGRDDATVGPRSPRLPFKLGPPIRDQPKKDEPKKDEPKEAPKDTRRETAAPPTAPTAPKENTQEEAKSTATTKKAPGIFHPLQPSGQPASKDGKIVRGPVMGVADEKEIRRQTPIPVKNAREQAEKGGGKKRPQSILDAAQPVVCSFVSLSICFLPKPKRHSTPQRSLFSHQVSQASLPINVPNSRPFPSLKTKNR